MVAEFGPVRTWLTQWLLSKDVDEIDEDVCGVCEQIYHDSLLLLLPRDDGATSVVCINCWRRYNGLNMDTASRARHHLMGGGTEEYEIPEENVGHSDTT